jgi:hypothetical protein
MSAEDYLRSTEKRTSQHGRFFPTAAAGFLPLLHLAAEATQNGLGLLREACNEVRG